MYELGDSVPEVRTAVDPDLDLQRLEGATGLIWSLEDAKVYLKVDQDEEDDLIEGLIAAAQSLCERTTNRALGEQTFTLTVSGGGEQIGPRIELPRPPFRELVSATVVGWQRESDLDVTTIKVRGIEPAVLTLPLARSIEAQELVVTYKAGYANLTEAPPELVQAVKLLVAHWYENREASTPANRDLREPSFGVKQLLDVVRYSRL